MQNTVSRATVCIDTRLHYPHTNSTPSSSHQLTLFEAHAERTRTGTYMQRQMVTHNSILPALANCYTWSIRNCSPCLQGHRLLISTRWLTKLRVRDMVKTKDLRKKGRRVRKPYKSGLHSPSCLLTSVEGGKVVEMNECQRQNDSIWEKKNMDWGNRTGVSMWLTGNLMMSRGEE